jgi:hypothetical protein
VVVAVVQALLVLRPLEVVVQQTVVLAVLAYHHLLLECQ